MAGDADARAVARGVARSTDPRGRLPPSHVHRPPTAARHVVGWLLHWLRLRTGSVDRRREPSGLVSTARVRHQSGERGAVEDAGRVAVPGGRRRGDRGRRGPGSRRTAGGLGSGRRRARARAGERAGVSRRESRLPPGCRGGRVAREGVGQEPGRGGGAGMPARGTTTRRHRSGGSTAAFARAGSTARPDLRGHDGALARVPAARPLPTVDGDRCLLSVQGPHGPRLGGDARRVCARVRSRRGRGRLRADGGAPLSADPGHARLGQVARLHRTRGRVGASGSPAARGGRVCHRARSRGDRRRSARR